MHVSTDDGLTWQAVTFPHDLQPGLLRLTRTDDSPHVTTVRALAPLHATPTTDPLITQTDQDGYQTITNTDATTDADGYQTLPDATATPDSDGFETVERSD